MDQQPQPMDDTPMDDTPLDLSLAAQLFAECRQQRSLSQRMESMPYAERSKIVHTAVDNDHTPFGISMDQQPQPMDDTPMDDTPMYDTPMDDTPLDLSLAAQLFAECRQQRSLSQRMRTLMESMPYAERSKIVHTAVDNDHTPFGVAIFCGHVSMVQYLVKVCRADINLPMVQTSTAGRKRFMPPIFFVIGNDAYMPMLRVLAELGADLNTRVLNGMTALYVACVRKRWQAARFLVRRNAAVNVASEDGETCLMKSIFNSLVLVELLHKGADMNARDKWGDTALNLAAQHDCSESVIGLLHHGADPFIRNEDGHDALFTGSLNGHTDVCEALYRLVPYEIEDRIASHELIGSNMLIMQRNVPEAIWHLKAAQSMRNQKDRIIYKVPLPPRHEYGMGREFVTTDQLNELCRFPPALEIQCLMICERLIGLNQYMAQLLSKSGKNFYYRGQHIRAIILLGFALRVRPSSGALLSPTTKQYFVMLCHAIKHCVLNHPDASAADQRAGYEFVRGMLREITEATEANHRNTGAHPQSADEQLGFEGFFGNVMLLVYAIVHMAAGDDDRMQTVREIVGRLIQARFCAPINLKTMLHHSVQPDAMYKVFPSIHVTSVLLAAGADVNALTRCRCTPLHIVCAADEPDEEIIELLLDNGANTDRPNASDQVPVDLLRYVPRYLKHIIKKCTLQSLAARAAGQLPVWKRAQLPAELAQVAHSYSASGDGQMGVRPPLVKGVALADFCQCPNPVFGPAPPL